ncbi:MAG: hypothetical protein ACQESG_04810 [Nanobdellota archaeon]
MKRFILFFLLLPVCFSIGISPPDINIDYEPGKEISTKVRVINARDVEIPARITADGFLSNYTTFDKETFLIPPRSSETIGYTITLPEGLEPGPHKGYIVIKDNKEYGGGMFSVSVRVKQTVRTFVSYPGKFAILTVNAENVNEGERVPYTISIENKGQEPIREATLELAVRAGDKTPHTHTTGGLTVMPDTTHTIKDTLSPLEKGEYSLEATFIYDEEKTSEDQFFVGAYEVLLSNHSQRLYAGEITPFKVRLKSNWNGEIENVRVILDLRGKEYATQPVTLSAFQNKEQVIYVDDRTLTDGTTYNATLSVLFENQSFSRDVTLPVEKRAAEESPLNVSVVSVSLLAILIILIAVHIYISRRK